MAAAAAAAARRAWQRVGVFAAAAVARGARAGVPAGAAASVVVGSLVWYTVPTAHAAAAVAAASPATTPAAATVPPPSLPPPPWPPVVRAVRDDAALNELVTGRAVLLVARGHKSRDVKVARAALAAGVAALGEAARGLSFWVLDDTTPAPQADAFQARLGIELDVPFIMILDEFLKTERKFVSSGAEAATAGGVAAMVCGYLNGALTPLRIGQPRPPRDRSAACAVRVPPRHAVEKPTLVPSAQHPPTPTPTPGCRTCTRW